MPSLMVAIGCRGSGELSQQGRGTPRIVFDRSVEPVEGT